MKRIVRKFHSFAEEERVNMEYWQSLSGEEKLKILETIRLRYYTLKNEYPERFQRVYRIIKRKPR